MTGAADVAARAMTKRRRSRRIDRDVPPPARRKHPAWDLLNELASANTHRGHRACIGQRARITGRLPQSVTNDNPAVARVLNRIGFWLTLAGHTRKPTATRAMPWTCAAGSWRASPDVASSLIGLATLEVAQGSFRMRSSRRAVRRHLHGLVVGIALATAAAQSLGRGADRARRYQEAEPLLTHSYAS